jgi:multimeric flavodoxin WrbA
MSGNDKVEIVGVISSSHRHGNTATLVGEALAGARELGADTEEIFLPELELEYCSGCLACNKTGRCVLNDGFEDVRARLRKADGIILSSPVFGAAPSAMMKNLLDRLGIFEFMTSSVFGGKYVGVIVTASAFGAGETAATLARATLGTLFQRTYVSGTVAVRLGTTVVKDSPDHLARARALGRRLVEDRRSGRTYPLQDLSGRVKRSFIEASMRKTIVSNREAMRGVYDSLAERGQLA